MYNRGTPGDDTINGTPGTDIICSRGGKDTINAGGGQDLIFSGAGADTINAGGGNDWVWSGQGADTIDGGSGNDRVRSGRGADTIKGGAGNDLLIGGKGDDTIRGNAGEDRILGHKGADILSGGKDADEIFGGRGTDLIDGDGGPDRITGGSGNDLIRGGGDADTIRAGRGADIVWGESGRDTINGNRGNDSLLGGAGNDTITGGNGQDICGGANTYKTCESESGPADPTLSILTPQQGDLLLPGDVHVTVDAQPAGPPVEVALSASQTLLSAPSYTGVVSDVEPQTSVLTATWFFGTVEIPVTVAQPVVNILEPAQNYVLSGSELVVSAEVTPAEAAATVFIDGVDSGQLAGPDFDLTVQTAGLAPGPHVVEVELAGATDTVVLHVSTTPPTNPFVDVVEPQRTPFAGPPLTDDGSIGVWVDRTVTAPVSYLATLRQRLIDNETVTVVFADGAAVDLTNGMVLEDGTILVDGTAHGSSIVAGEGQVDADGSLIFTDTANGVTWHLFAGSGSEVRITARAATDVESLEDADDQPPSAPIVPTPPDQKYPADDPDKELADSQITFTGPAPAGTPRTSASQIVAGRPLIDVAVIYEQAARVVPLSSTSSRAAAHKTLINQLNSIRARSDAEVRFRFVGFLGSNNNLGSNLSTDIEAEIAAGSTNFAQDFVQLQERSDSPWEFWRLSF